MNRIGVILVIVFFSIGMTFSQTPFFKEYSLGELYKDARVNILYELKNGYIWFGTTQGLFRYDGLEFEQFLMPDSITGNLVSALYEDHKNRLWVGYKDGNIFYKEEQDQNKFIKWNLEEGTPQVPITSFYDDKKGRFWIATYGEGLYVFKQNRLYNIDIDDGLPGNDIYAMATDRDDNIWIGTDGGIVKCAMNDQQKTIEIFSTANGLPDDIVRAILTDEKGNFWIGMHDGGICYFDPYSKKVETSFSNWNQGIVNALELFEERELWIGTEGNGVMRLDFKTQKSTPIRIGVGSAKSKIYDLHKDVEGNIWVVSNTNSVCSANRQFEIIQNPLPNLQAVMVDNEDQLWIGTQNGLFLHHLNEEGESFFKTILENLNVLSLYEDKFKNVWIGTYGEGVYCLDSNKIHTRHFTEKDGLTNSSIFSIEGENDKIWLATLGGVTEIENEINVFSQSNLRVKKLSQEKGLGTNYVYTVFIDSKGRTWFGTDSNGVSVLENGKIINYTHADSLPLRTVSSITEDRLGHIWLSTDKEGIFEFDSEIFHHLTIKEGIRDLAITSLISDAKDNILVIHPSGIDILDPVTKHLIYYDAEIGVENIKPNLNVVCSDKNGNIWIGTEDHLIRYTALKENLEIHPRTQLNEVSVLLDPVDFQNLNTFGHNQNSLVFRYVGLWYTDPTTVKYRYKLEGVNPDWVISRDRQATYPNLAPGEYTFSVTSTENDAFDQEPVISYSFKINSPIWMRPWFLLLLMMTISAIIYFIINEREKQLKRRADLNKERVESQLELLKSQINPHFLFNNFNTLIAIIEEDSPLAIEYVERLSDFYRSILQYREKDVIQIQEELELIKNYEFLLQKRYGDTLKLTINSNGTLNNSYIVPLTLQILVENAVKHNIISKSKPLNIEITTEGDQYISITNNIQKKLTSEPSTGFGLQSIQSRYALLSKKEVQIVETEKQFKILIPILKKH